MVKIMYGQMFGGNIQDPLRDLNFRKFKESFSYFSLHFFKKNIALK